jgi:hypothetical protein
MAKTKRWVRKVKTVSTAPPKDLFTKDARTIAKTMAKKSVSPKGAGSGVRMIQYFINRGGKNLSVTRKRELEKAKAILQKRMKAKKTKWTVAIDSKNTDGLATGSTLRAAVLVLKRRKPARVIAAVPVAAPETCKEFRHEVDEVVCALTPEPFMAVGQWYWDFSQYEKVRELLH